MEIYSRKIRWLGIVFIIPALWFSLSLAGYTSQTIKPSETVVAYIVIGVCLVVALQCFVGSTRFYFDNGVMAGIQVRKHFYGEKIIRHLYSDIVDVTVRCYRRGNEGMPRYRVGIRESTTMFGGSAVAFTELRSFGGGVEERLKAQAFAKKISSYTSLKYFDDSDVVRAEMRPHNHAI